MASCGSEKAKESQLPCPVHCNSNFALHFSSALTRPGRFDNRITISMPDIKARHKILELHSKKITLDESEYSFDLVLPRKLL